MRRTLQRRAIPAGYKEKASALVRFDYAGRYFLLSHLKRFCRRVCKILLGPIMWSCYVLIMRSPEIGICKKRLRSNGNRDIILQPAFQAPLWHILVFRTCNVRKKISLSRTFSSGRVTSGKDETAGVIKEWLVEVEERHTGRHKKPPQAYSTGMEKRKARPWGLTVLEIICV